MNNEAIKQGFLENGERVSVIDELESGFLIERYIGYQDWEGEWNERLSGNKEFADIVLKSAPESVYSQFVKDAESRLSKINSEISDKRDELKSIRDEIKSIEDKCKNNKALNHIFDFIAGDFEYFAFPNCYNGNYIRTKNTTLSDEGDRYNRETKLLTLYGRTKGDLQWNINRYSDGSGADSIAIPCKTAEDAKEVVANYMTTELDRMLKSDNYTSYNTPKYCDWLLANGYTVNPKHLQKSEDIKKSTKESELKQAQLRYDAALKELNKIKQK